MLFGYFQLFGQFFVFVWIVSVLWTVWVAGIVWVLLMALLVQVAVWIVFKKKFNNFGCLKLVITLQDIFSDLVDILVKQFHEVVDIIDR